MPKRQVCLLLLEAEEKLVPVGHVPVVGGAPSVRGGGENGALICPID
jgi:hypothetical protein